jgi:hypothetical protein
MGPKSCRAVGLSSYPPGNEEERHDVLAALFYVKTSKSFNGQVAHPPVVSP